MKKKIRKLLLLTAAGAFALFWVYSYVEYLRDPAVGRRYWGPGTGDDEAADCDSELDDPDGGYAGSAGNSSAVGDPGNARYYTELTPKQEENGATSESQENGVMLEEKVDEVASVQKKDGGASS